ncbi:hypothetical protein BJF90_17960 [Pseudonocardia sp. CNS-004]|nr:hypothetical protein BJF90_17960 [Pseudonocardia sp. CNS-004]
MTKPTTNAVTRSMASSASAGFQPDSAQRSNNGSFMRTTSGSVIRVPLKMRAPSRWSRYSERSTRA